MNSIRDEPVALDTNEFIFALRHDAHHRTCRALIFDNLTELKIYMPLQVLLELQHNLSNEEMQEIITALNRAKEVIWDYAPAPLNRVRHWEQRGAKKGDAVIVAHLEAADIHYFVTSFLRIDIFLSSYQIYRSRS